jgi:plasmid maintenance system antidote protein VapI
MNLQATYDLAVERSRGGGADDIRPVKRAS